MELHILNKSVYSLIKSFMAPQPCSNGMFYVINISFCLLLLPFNLSRVAHISFSVYNDLVKNLIEAAFFPACIKSFS